MMMISIPAVPPSPNELRRKYRHPHAYKKLREQWEHDLSYGVSCARHRSQLQKMAEDFRAMHVEIVVYHARLYDADNLTGAIKPILDALVNIRFLRDDSPDCLELSPVQQFKSKENRTVVKIGPAKD